jgi:hypothetical protein
MTSLIAPRSGSSAVISRPKLPALSAVERAGRDGVVSHSIPVDIGASHPKPVRKALLILAVIVSGCGRGTNPSPRPSFVLDASKPFVVELGRGSGWRGLDIIRIDQTGSVEMQRVGRDANMESAALRLPAADIEKLVDLINAHQLTSMARTYSDPGVADGTQWVLWIQQSPADKSIYCNNAFPKQITAFAGDLDALLQTAGAGSVVWSAVPRQKALDQQSALWDRIRSAK